MIKTTAKTVDEYIASFPTDIQIILKDIRSVVKRSATEAGETIKYDMPTLTFHGNMLSYGVFKNHIGIYPAPSGDDAFNEAIDPYRSGKSTLKFPINKPMPLELIAQIVNYRVKATLDKAAEKSSFSPAFSSKSELDK